MNKIFDTHAHYDDKRFDEDRDELLSALFAESICGIVQCATDPVSCKAAIALAEQYDNLYAAVGFHPENLEGLKEHDLDQCRLLLKHPKVVAVGEIGLDYYWDSSPRPVQQDWFVSQMQMAKAADMPVIVHDRDAHEDTLRLLLQEKPHGVLHAFSGSVEMANEVIKLGMYIGLGGVVTFKNARKAVEVAATVPLDRLVLETDAPYMSPEPHRGRRNDSSKILYVAQKIAELRDISVEDLLQITTDNAKRLFRIKS